MVADPGVETTLVLPRVARRDGKGLGRPVAVSPVTATIPMVVGRGVGLTPVTADTPDIAPGPVAGRAGLPRVVPGAKGVAAVVVPGVTVGTTDAVAGAVLVGRAGAVVTSFLLTGAGLVALALRDVPVVPCGVTLVTAGPVPFRLAPVVTGLATLVGVPLRVAVTARVPTVGGPARLSRHGHVGRRPMAPTVVRPVAGVPRVPLLGLRLLGLHTAQGPAPPRGGVGHTGLFPGPCAGIRPSGLLPVAVTPTRLAVVGTDVPAVLAPVPTVVPRQAETTGRPSTVAVRRRPGRPTRPLGLLAPSRPEGLAVLGPNPSLRPATTGARPLAVLARRPLLRGETATGGVALALALAAPSIAPGLATPRHANMGLAPANIVRGRVPVNSPGLRAAGAVEAVLGVPSPVARPLQAPEVGTNAGQAMAIPGGQGVVPDVVTAPVGVVVPVVVAVGRRRPAPAFPVVVRDGLVPMPVTPAKALVPVFRPGVVRVGRPRHTFVGVLAGLAVTGLAPPTRPDLF